MMHIGDRSAGVTSIPSRKGFTLIEMVVVVTVVAILASVALVNYNGVRDKAEAARIATQLHYIEDAVVEAIIAGAGVADFRKIDTSNVATSVLGAYLTEANFSDVPPGITLAISSSHDGGGFNVWIEVQGSAAQEGILADLQAVFPRALNRMGDFEWVQIASSTLAVMDKTVP